MHPATKALKKLVDSSTKRDIALALNTTAANVDRNTRGGVGYENGPHIDHRQIYALHRRMMPNSSGWLPQE